MSTALVYGHQMHLDPEDTVITPCLMGGRTFERMTVAALRQMIKSGETVVDGGANVGYFTLLLARLVGPDGRVYAFEPDPRAFHLLSLNVKANGYKNVVLSNTALGRRSGKATLYLNERNRGDNRLSPIDGATHIEVPVTSLDESVPGDVSFVKLDIQGCERDALIGANRLLSQDCVSIACELWPPGLIELGSSPEELFDVLVDFDLYYPDESRHEVRPTTRLELLANVETESAVNLLAIKGRGLDIIRLPRIQFHHGLADSANAAHLFALYKSLGYDLLIDCSSDKALLFQAAGCEVLAGAQHSHPWDHPPIPIRPIFDESIRGNRIAWNVSRGGLPDIGTGAERWAELVAVRLDLERFVSDGIRQKIGDFIATLTRPVILVHTKANTSPQSKNYPDDMTVELYQKLLDRTGGSLILLDWDNRAPRLRHARVRHLQDDWEALDLTALYQTIKRADLLIGVNSGPLHFVRFTETPAVGIWTYHHPCEFALPRLNTTHVVGSQARRSQAHRHMHSLIDCAEVLPAPAVITAAAVRTMMLGNHASS